MTHCSSSPFGVPGHRAPSHGRAESHVNISVAMVFEAFYKTAMSVRAGAPARAATASAPASSPRFAPMTTPPPRHRLTRTPRPLLPTRSAPACTWASSSRVLCGREGARRSARPRRRARSPPRRAARAPTRRGSSVQPGRASRFSLFRAFPPARSRPRARVRDPPSGRTSRAATPRPPARLARGREPRRLARPRAIASRIRPTAMAPDEKKRSAHSWPPRVRRVSEENKQPEPPPLVRSFD